jgi:pimeloyl-ACP methyl ester carboxylesterase
MPKTFTPFIWKIEIPFLRHIAILLFFLIGIGLPCSATAAKEKDIVVLLHGLGRTTKSMDYMANRLTVAGYKVVNLSYPSRKEKIETLVDILHKEMQACCLEKSTRLHFVTHSLGGILVRGYLSNNRPENLGRVVMLSPPNKGSDVVDYFEEYSLFKYFFGPAAAELGTGQDSFPNRLGPADFEVGIITGNRTIDPISSWIIDGDDDGKVSVEQAQLEGMADFMVVQVSHAYIMENQDVVNEVIYFLQNGRFSLTEMLEPDNN